MKPMYLAAISCALFLTLVPLRAEPVAIVQPVGSADTSPTEASVSNEITRSQRPKFTPGILPEGGPPPLLTPEESRLLAGGRLKLQEDPEIMDINAQITALMEKRDKLTEVKLRQTNPEVADIFIRIKQRQEKMRLERLAQKNAYQAKLNAAQGLESKIHKPMPVVTAPSNAVQAPAP